MKIHAIYQLNVEKPNQCQSSARKCNSGYSLIMPNHCKWKLTFLEHDDYFLNINVI